MEKIFYAFIIIFSIVSIMFLIGSLLYLKFGIAKWLYHNGLHWHLPNDKQKEWFDGCSIHFRCKYCGKEIKQDSQGNWY